MISFFCYSTCVLLVGSLALSARVSGVGKELVSAQRYRSPQLIEEASLEARLLLEQFCSVGTKADADALAARIEESLSERSVLWECLRRQGFMELAFFWEDSGKCPSHHEAIRSLQKRGLWTPKLRSAVKKWHARLGYHFAVWTRKRTHAHAELKWRRREHAKQLFDFKEKFPDIIGAGDGLSAETPLKVKYTEIASMRRVLLNYLHNVVNCGMANYAFYHIDNSGSKHYLLQVHAVHRELGRDYIYFFDVTEIMHKHEGDAPSLFYPEGTLAEVHQSVSSGG